MLFCFFFQAEDGIRDADVTGVQTCALPIWHCTKYECVMSGTNYLGETDSRPIDACPECMAKVCWLSNVSPKQRYDRLAAFCRKNGLTAEAEDFERKSKAVS